MRLVFLNLVLILFAGPAVLSQEKYLVTGTVRDSLTGESLIGATVFIINSSAGTQSASDGTFSIPVKSGNCEIRISYIGYRTKTIHLNLTGDVRINVALGPDITQTEAIVVTAENPSRASESSRTGFFQISGKEISDLPSLMGEPDLIRALHYSPGISTSGDGNSGFYVRGGNVDQNLIIMDNAVVYNPSHVLGFFSVFNSDIISTATLIKSGIPANYGGRISSVLSVRTIDGDFENHHISGTLGLVYSKVTLQGPAIKNKLSYLISFRKTYVNEVIRPLMQLFSKDPENVLGGSTFGMYDLNIKLSARLNQKNRLSAICYKGRDNFALDAEDMEYKAVIDWGNSLIALNWNRIKNDSSYMLNSLSYSSYNFHYDASQFIMAMDLYSSIRNINYRMEINKNSRKAGFVKSGIEAKYYNFVPNRFMLTINNTDLNYSTYQDLFAGELAVFASWEKDLSESLLLSTGIRAGNYRQLGPYTQISRAGNEIRDTLKFGQFKTVKTYRGLEPRISLRLQTSPVSSLKASYTRNYQYIHIASASSVTMPSDIWIPSTSTTAPQFGDQFTLGYYRNFHENTILTSAEAYYKKLHNQVELLYGLGASLQDVSFENSLTTGKGYAAGIEFFLQKQTGRLTGSVAYSLAYTERQFDEINDGRPFPARYDRRHEINFTAGYKPGGRWEFSAAFVYATGNAMTVPVQIYLFDNNINTQYSTTNAYRMPPYHRLDLSANYSLKKTGKFESVLNFSVLNVYNRANPFLIFFDIQGDILNEKSLSITAKQISIFPVMPSVSWSFKF